MEWGKSMAGFGSSVRDRKRSLLKEGITVQRQLVWSVIIRCKDGGAFEGESAIEDEIDTCHAELDPFLRAHA